MAKHFDENGRFIGRNGIARQAWEKRVTVEPCGKQYKRKPKHKKKWSDQ